MQDLFKPELKFPSFESCWERLQKRTDIRKQSQLADLVGKTSAYISKLKKEDVFLPEWAYFVSKKYDVSIDWILTGKNYVPDEEKDDIDIFLEELKDWLLTFEHNKDKKRWFEMTFSKTFPEFEDFVFKQLNERLDADHLNNK